MLLFSPPINGLTKPQSGSSINRRHPQAHGLVGAFAFNEGSAPLRNLVNGYLHTAQASPVRTLGRSTGVSYDVSARHEIGNVFDEIDLGTGNLSAFLIGRLTFGGSFSRYLFNADGAGSTPRLAFSVTTGGNLQWLRVTIAADTTSGTITSGQVYAVGVAYDRSNVRIWCAHWPTGNVVINETLASGAAVGGTGSAFTIGNFDASGNFGLQGDLYGAFFWRDRMLLPTDFQMLAKSPWSLVSAPRRTWLNAGASGVVINSVTPSSFSDGDTGIVVDGTGLQ